MSDESHASFGPDAVPDWEALARFRDGESPEPEARRVRAWLAAHPEDAGLLDAMDAAFAEHLRAPAEAELATDVDVEGALARVRRRRGAEVPEVATTGAPREATKVIPFPRRGAHVPEIRPASIPAAAARPRRARAVWAGIGVAAAAAALLTVGLLRREDGGARLAPAGGSVATTIGQRDSVRLPDGSRVVLAPGSRIEVARGYGAGARVVTLDGAALFTVTHDAKSPFTVRAGRATVHDVGTVFSVRTDGVGEFGAAVAVTEGIVMLRGPGLGDGPREVTLNAGDRGLVRANGEVVAAAGTASAADAAWATGRLEYRAVPLAQVRADLRRWYGLELQVEDAALAERTLTATFDQTDTAQRVLEVIALAMGATVDRFGTTAVLRPAAGAAR